MPRSGGGRRQEGEHQVTSRTHVFQNGTGQFASRTSRRVGIFGRSCPSAHPLLEARHCQLHHDGQAGDPHSTLRTLTVRWAGMCTWCAECALAAWVQVLHGCKCCMGGCKCWQHSARQHSAYRDWTLLKIASCKHVPARLNAVMAPLEACLC